MKIETEVYCSLEIEGIHNWANCPFDEVAYLRDPHRHMFGIKAYKKVNHDDRDVEFIMLKHQIQKYFFETYWDFHTKIHKFGSMSCEMIGAKLIEKFGLSKCEVNEDGENGAIMVAINECDVCGV